MKRLDLDDVFKSYFLDNVKLSFEDFTKASAVFLQDKIHSFYIVCFENISDKKEPFSIDLESCMNFILDSLGSKDQISLPGKKYNGMKWSVNDILFPFTKKYPPKPEFGTKSFYKYRKWRDDLEFDCERNFWNLKGVDDMPDLSEIKFFKDYIFPAEQIEKIKRTGVSHVDRNGWISFMDKLIEHYFSGFSYNARYSTMKWRRYTTEIEPGLLFGFECDLSEVHRKLKNYSPSFGDYFNMVCFKSCFKANQNVEDYYYTDHMDVISLGILGNPYFYQPCYPMEGYFAIDSYQKSEYEIPIEERIIFLNLKECNLPYSRNSEAAIVRHAVFYMFLLSQTSLPYLELIKKSLLQAINHKNS